MKGRMKGRRAVSPYRRGGNPRFASWPVENPAARGMPHWRPRGMSAQVPRVGLPAREVCGPLSVQEGSSVP